jgi:hypothetical protein
VAFPETSLGLRAELLLGAAWTDITKDVYTREPIQITHGTASEGAQTDPASCSLLLNNKDGRYSPRNPLSPYYGQLGRNTPVRVTVPGPESYLALDGSAEAYATTPNAGPLSITGDLDIRAEVTADWSATRPQFVIGKWDAAAGQRSYMLVLEAGTLGLYWSAVGTSGMFVRQLLPAMPERAAVRATLDVDNGAGGKTIRLYWAPSMVGPWFELPAYSEAGTTSIFSGGAPLRVAPTSTTVVPPSRPMEGRVHRAEVRAGINGPIVAAPDFTSAPVGTRSFSDSAGRSWQVQGPAEITNKEGLFAGEVSEWPPRWSPGGHDAWVPVQAAGILRRLGQGRRPLQSTLRRRVPSDPALLAYWPMEDGETATQLYSPIDGVGPLRVTGLDLAADDSLPGSAPLPTLGAVASLSATVPATSVKGWQTEMVYRLPTLPTIQTEILRVSVAGSTMRTVHVFASTAGIRVEARNADGDTLAFILYTVPAALADFAGVWNRLAIYVSDHGGGQTRVACAWRDIAAGAWWYTYTLITGAMGTATAVTGNWGSGTQGMTLGHLSVFALPGASAGTPGTFIYNGADSGFTNERALDRLQRLGQEEPTLRLSTRPGDTTAGSERMGPQGQVELMTLVGEVVETDGGVLYERMDRLGLTYRDRATLYNQAPALTLDYAAGHVAPPLEPVEDDAGLRNDVTVTRQGGSSGRAVVEDGTLSVLPPEQGGVGVYEEAVTLSLGTDEQPQQIAGWLAHLGTWDEARYPSVRVLLHRQPQLIPAVLRLRPGDLVRITNPPPFTGPGPLDLLVRQIQHQPRPRAWEVTLVCSPAGPYRVGVRGDVDRGRRDTAGSVLAAPVASSATSLSVATTVGPLWTTAAAVFPFDVLVGGERMTVRNVTGTGSPQTFTVTRSVNKITKAQTAGTGVSLAHPAVRAL